MGREEKEAGDAKRKQRFRVRVEFDHTQGGYRSSHAREVDDVQDADSSLSWQEHVGISLGTVCGVVFGAKDVLEVLAAAVTWIDDNPARDGGPVDEAHRKFCEAAEAYGNEVCAWKERQRLGRADSPEDSRPT